MSPEWQRDILLDRIPAIVSKYGDVAATAAAQWYEETRAKQVTGAYEAIASDPFPEQPIRDRLRYGVKDLFKENSEARFSEWIEGAIQRWILYSGRQTIAANVLHDGANPRFARVPRGQQTCAWCEMLCSRGFVYYTSKTALEKDGSGFRYHDRCDCQAVPEWDHEIAHIEGYDPDAMYERYQKAREAAGESASVKSITYQMRRLYPYLYTDGVTENK